MSARAIAPVRSVAIATAIALTLASPVRAAADEPEPEPPTTHEEEPKEEPSDAPIERPAEPERDPVLVRDWPEEPTPPAPLPPRPAAVIGLRLDASYAHHLLLALPTNGGDVGLAIGAQGTRKVAIWFATRAFLGRTLNGLEVGSGTVGLDVEGVLGRARLGGGFGVLAVGFGRATRSETISSGGVNASVSARLDLAQSGATSIFLRAVLDAGWEVHGSAYWGPSVGLGAAFDLSGDRAALER